MKWLCDELRRVGQPLVQRLQHPENTATAITAHTGGYVMASLPPDAWRRIRW